MQKLSFRQNHTLVLLSIFPTSLIPTLYSCENGEETTNNGTRLETILRVGYSVVPVREGDARTAGTGKLIKRVNEELA